MTRSAGRIASCTVRICAQLRHSYPLNVPTLTARVRKLTLVCMTMKPTYNDPVMPTHFLWSHFIVVEVMPHSFSPVSSPRQRAKKKAMENKEKAYDRFLRMATIVYMDSTQCEVFRALVGYYSREKSLLGRWLPLDISTPVGKISP